MSRSSPVPEPSILRHPAGETPGHRQPRQRHDLHRRHRRTPACSRCARSSRLCVALRIHPNTLTLIGVIINVGGGLGARVRALHPGRRDHDRRQHLRLHRRQGRAPAAPAVALRRLLGFDARPVLGPRAPDRPDLSVLEARPQRLRDGRGAGAHLLDHDELRAGARRIARREMQGRASWSGPSASCCS